LVGFISSPIRDFFNGLLIAPASQPADKTLLAGRIPFGDKTLIAAPPPNKVEPVSEPVKPGLPVVKYIIAGLALIFLLFIILLVVVGGWFVFQMFFPFS